LALSGSWGGFESSALDGWFSSGGGDGILRGMDDKHPHDGATYTIVRNDDGTFGVEVKIPGANPITISGLEGEAGAEKWIARHKETVAKGKPRRAFTRAKRT
jgi:hypothetical protein